MAARNITWGSEIEDRTTKITIVSSCASLLGGFFIIFTYNKIPRIQNTPRRLLVYITVSDLIYSVGYLVAAFRAIDLFVGHDTDIVYGLRSDDLCKAQSFATSYASIASFIWTDVLAIYLFAVVKCEIGANLSYRKNFIMHVVGWLVPAIPVIVAVFFGVLGEDISTTSGPWCWIATSNLSRIWQIFWLFMAGKLFELATYVITIVLYIWMKIIIYKQPRHGIEGLNLGIRQEDTKFWLTWIVLLVLRLAGTIRTFLVLLNKTESDIHFDEVLLYIQSFGDTGQAFVNCIIYCFFDADIRDFLRRSFGTFCTELSLIRCCRRCSSDDDESPLIVS